jgi:hypothetical protein
MSKKVDKDDENDFSDLEKVKSKPFQSSDSKLRKYTIDLFNMPIKKHDWTNIENNPSYQELELKNLFKVNDSDEFDDLPELIPVNSDEFLDTAKKGHIKCDSQSDNK